MARVGAYTAAAASASRSRSHRESSENDNVCVFFLLSLFFFLFIQGRRVTAGPRARGIRWLISRRRRWIVAALTATATASHTRTMYSKHAFTPRTNTQYRKTGICFLAVRPRTAVSSRSLVVVFPGTPPPRPHHHAARAMYIASGDMRRYWIKHIPLTGICRTHRHRERLWRGVMNGEKGSQGFNFRGFQTRTHDVRQRGFLPFAATAHGGRRQAHLSTSRRLRPHGPRRW